MEVTTLTYFEAGPAFSYVMGHVDEDVARKAILADEWVSDIVKDLIDNESIDSSKELIIFKGYKGPMSPEFDGDIALHMDDEGNQFIDLFDEDGPDREAVTYLDWEDKFV